MTNLGFSGDIFTTTREDHLEESMWGCTYCYVQFSNQSKELW